MAVLIAANEISSVDHRGKRVDAVKIYLDEGISVDFVNLEVKAKT